MLLALSGVAAALFAIGSAFYLSATVDRSLDELQRETDRRRVEAVVQAVDQNAMHLLDYTKGYAMWDDTYNFLQTRNPEYGVTNYDESVMSVSPADFVAIYDLDGRMIYAAALDAAGKSIPPPSELAGLPVTEHFAQMQTPSAAQTTIEWIDGEAYIVAACSVTDSSGTRPPRGHFVFGERISQEMLSRLRNLTGVEIAVEPCRPGASSELSLGSPYLGTAEVTLQPSRDDIPTHVEVVFREDNTIQPSVKFSLTLTSRTSQTGRQLSRLVRTVFLVTGFGFALVVTGAVFVIRRRRRESEALAAARDRAAELAESAAAADRAKSAFLATMSHEIRTPLNAILGYTQLLESQPRDAETAEGLAVIKESGGTLQRILNDILDFSKIEAGKLDIEPEPTSTRDLVAGVAAIYQRLAAAKGVSFELSIDPGVPACIAIDSARLRQVLTNLLSNAVKFTESGTIRIRVSTIPENDGSEAGEILQITVHDEGIGISIAHERALFEPFHQMDSGMGRRYEGSGLGLAISRRLCELMQGSLTYERATPGSIFHINLPVVRVPDATHSTNGSSDIASIQHNLRVLIVDDNAVNARLLSRIVEKLGVRPEIAPGGEQAVKLTRTLHPDLIFMDVQMPDVDGLEATRRIRRLETELQRNPCRIIAVTADILDTSRTSALDAGMDGYLCKPIKMPEVIQCLAETPSAESLP